MGKVELTDFEREYSYLRYGGSATEFMLDNLKAVQMIKEEARVVLELAEKEVKRLDSLKEHVSETNKVVQVRRCLEEVATTINPFIDEVIEQFNLKDKSIVAKEIQYRGVGLKGDFGENIHRSDDEVIYILKEDKTVGLIVIRRTEFNNAEITMVKTEERFKEKSND